MAYRNPGQIPIYRRVPSGRLKRALHAPYCHHTFIESLTPRIGRQTIQVVYFLKQSEQRLVNGKLFGDGPDRCTAPRKSSYFRTYAIRPSGPKRKMIVGKSPASLQK
jgi:hypothetical protein